MIGNFEANMNLKLLVLLSLLVLPGIVLAQSPFTYSISNVADIPLGSTNTIKISFSFVSGTNWLNAEGINSLDIGLRMVNPVSGSVSTVNAFPTIGLANPTADISVNPLFGGAGSAQSAFDPSATVFENVPGFTNIVGFTLVAPGATGAGQLTSPVSLFIADVRLRGDILGPVTIQAYFLRPSQALDPLNPFFPNGQIFTGGTFKDLGIGSVNGGFGPTDPGFASFNVIAAIPEPTTWALIILSIASGIGGVVYYKRHYMHSAEKQLALAQEGEVEGE